jgi:hypothetical protein
VQANLELAFGRSVRRCSGRLLAVSRLLTAHSPKEVRGRSAADLGRWDEPLSLINEVSFLRLPFLLECHLKFHFISCSVHAHACCEGTPNLRGVP